jgi:hypothetical protein
MTYTIHNDPRQVRMPWAALPLAVRRRIYQLRHRIKRVKKPQTRLRLEMQLSELEQDGGVTCEMKQPSSI